MKCGDAEEFVSALLDGQTIPREYAEHIAQCTFCQELLRDFSLMGGELRGFGSLARSEAAATRAWVKPGGSVTEWWTKGWQVMRIPRIVVATLTLVIIGLGSKLALVEVRAHSEESVLMLKIKMGDEPEFSCPVSVVDEKRQSCGGLASIQGVSLAYSISFVRQEGERVLLSVRSEYPSSFPKFGPNEVKSMPETQHWFTPGETLQLKIAGATKISITGQWSDHIPSFFVLDDALDPAVGELRVMSPVILQNGRLVQDFKGSSAISNKPNMGIQLYWPGGGRFSISPVAVPGAVVAKVEMNRISFVADGQTYEVVTGMPVSRKGEVWVLHDASYSTGEAGWQIGTQLVSEMR